MGMIFQEYALVERLTVMENVLSGRLGYVGFWRSFTRRFPQTDVDEAFRLLDRVGLLAMADKRADELSGGQRQRVGIARALIQNPALLLVDEPTASLDPKTSRQIMRLICELCAERDLAAIINIHDVALAQMFVQRVIGLRARRDRIRRPARGADAGRADHDLRRGRLGGDHRARSRTTRKTPECRAHDRAPDHRELDLLIGTPLAQAAVHQAALAALGAGGRRWSSI